MVEYTVNNYGPLNKAVEVESEKYRALSKVRLGKAFLYFCAGAALLILAASLAYGLIRYLFSAPDFFLSGATSSEGLEESRMLQSLSNNEAARTLPDGTSAMIEREFTSFTKVQAESGEMVVTGKKFASENLQKPFLQYCYLEGTSGGLSGIQLAERLSDGTIELFQDDITLNRYARQYCRFTER